jgi:ferredoxin
MMREAPACMHCGQYNDGTVVGAHSNSLRDGKGKGIKAHDYRVAAMCHTCHMELDQGNKMSKDERREMWEEAHRKTIGWLFESGRIKV